MKPLEVKQHDDGTWYARPYLGTNAVTGKPIRPYKRFPDATSEAEALELAQEWVNGLSGAANLRTTMRLVDVLNRYVDSLESLNQPYNTVKAYRGLVSRYIEPNVGDIDIDEMRPHLVETLYGVVMMRGGKDGKPLSPQTVIQLHWFLSGAYKWAGKMEVTPFNPMQSVDPPSPVPTEATAYDEGQFLRLSRALGEILCDEGTGRADVRRRTAAFAAYLALWTGERCGEVCANSRQDAQLMRKMMHVGHTMVERKGGLYRQPRTKGGKGRNVSISDDVCGQIRRHYAWQASFLPERVDKEGLMVCCSADGGYMRPSAVSSVFSELRDEIGLPKSTSFHTLRHTHATYLLMCGEDMRTVQERLGHANVATTLSLYAHVLPGRDQAAAASFAAAARRIGGAS